MATPVGHGLLGAGFAMAGNPGVKHHWLWLLFLAFSAVAADLDFLPGLFVGDINRWHHQGSHSLLAALIWAAGTALFFGCSVSRRARYRWARAGVVAGLAYASHLLLDCLTTDKREPFGIPLLWPFSDNAWIAPVTPIPGVAHGVPGDSLVSVLGSVFSLGNLYGAMIECLVVSPLLFVLWLVRKRMDD